MKRISLVRSFGYEKGEEEELSLSFQVFLIFYAFLSFYLRRSQRLSNTVFVVEKFNIFECPSQGKLCSHKCKFCALQPPAHLPKLHYTNSPCSSSFSCFPSDVFSSLFCDHLRFCPSSSMRSFLSDTDTPSPLKVDLGERVATPLTFISRLQQLFDHPFLRAGEA